MTPWRDAEVRGREGVEILIEVLSRSGVDPRLVAAVLPCWRERRDVVARVEQIRLIRHCRLHAGDRDSVPVRPLRIRDPARKRAKLRVNGRRIRREPRPEDPAAKEAGQASIDRAVAVVAEEHIFALGLVLCEEILEEVRPAEPPVILDACVHDEIVVVDDVATPRGEAVSSDEWMIQGSSRQRADLLGKMERRPDRLHTTSGRRDASAPQA
jgi:hypothetical protein